ncbi:MAG: hypothetical protein QOE70_1792 [Chthoniobacter sp.]|jgi:PAS domain S-box-containing protein|nr:hypothetical protein [Chthoniobacter sp.]
MLLTSLPLTILSSHAGAGPQASQRILVVDDNEAIHDDFRKILGGDDAEMDFDAEAAAVFGAPASSRQRGTFAMDFSFQGREALERVRAAVAAGRRYAVVFMDVRMPPGWDGLETAVKLWEVDPDLQIVLCTAYSDYSWDEMMAQITRPERLLVLKKPFDAIEILQFAHALIEKWSLLQAARQNTEGLERAVTARTAELKAAGECVREQAMLLEKARDAILVRDLDGKILFWNNGAERLYGWTAREALGRQFRELLGEDAAANQAAGEAALEHESWNGELSQTTKGGRAIQVECHLTLVRDDRSRPTSILAINTDVTERKQLEAQFLRAQRMDGIGALASGIAHDLNNLLGPLILGIDLLKAGAGGGTDVELLEVMSISAWRATNIVKQVLYFAKGSDSSRIALDPASLVREIKTISRETFPKSIEIRTVAPAETWLVKADSTQLHQVLLNLCVNARDAMPEGGTITLLLENLEIDEHYAAAIWGVKPGPYVLLKVEDTGTGIPAELVDKIFEPFFTTKEAKGTGLGLSTVFAIVKNHGGAVTVRSEPGSGTAFCVYLPAFALGSKAGAEIALSVAPIRGHGELVLVVDDEPSILSVTSQSIESSGYQVLTARDGVEAVALAGRYHDKIAIVLMDMIMPVLDGATSIRALRKMMPQIPIIATSGDGARVIEEKALAAGAARFISKPYSSTKLLQLIDEILRPEPGPHEGQPDGSDGSEEKVRPV